MTCASATNHRLEQRQTAKVESITGTFHCSSSGHFAAGKPLMLRGRKICQGCMDKRRNVMKDNARG